MDLVGFAGDVVKPLGKIELEVVFEFKDSLSRLFNNTLYDKVPYPERDRDVGHQNIDNIRVQNTWKTFGENTHDLGLILGETGQDCNLTQRRLEELLTEGGDGVRIPCDTVWIYK
ncbi:hypothetical protein Tco_0535512 [Tanacetum coccineum]